MYLKLYRVIDYSNMSWSDETVEWNEISFLRDESSESVLQQRHFISEVCRIFTSCSSPGKNAWLKISKYTESFASNVWCLADHYYY